MQNHKYYILIGIVSFFASLNLEASRLSNAENNQTNRYLPADPVGELAANIASDIADISNDVKSFRDAVTDYQIKQLPRATMLQERINSLIAAQYSSSADAWNKAINQIEHTVKSVLDETSKKPLLRLRPALQQYYKETLKDLDLKDEIFGENLGV